MDRQRSDKDAARTSALAPRVNGALPRIAAVRFLNTFPLIEELIDNEQIVLVRDVPSRLGELLSGGRADVALLPTIDFQQITPTPPVLPVGCIASDGPTMTVRVFSRVEAKDIRRLAIDSDSHTSVALAKVLWAECFGRYLEIVEGEPEQLLQMPDPPEAALLIGDKVVTDPPEWGAYQVDLGDAWRSLTGLPFVFATWAVGPDLAGGPRGDLAAVAAILSAARDHGVRRAGEIGLVNGPMIGWEARQAEEYLTRNIRYALTDRYREGMARFFELAHRYHVIESVAPLTYLPVG